MTKRVYVHIGAPKTGTTYVQTRLARNQASLAAHGVDYPLGGARSMFLAALDLVDRQWADQRERARGEWDRLMARVRECEGSVIISHEILAAATPTEVARAMSGLAGTEVHLVYAARDLARQIPSEWQEGVKHWHLPTFERFVEIVREAPREDPRLWFWRVQGLPDVLGRWARDLPPSQVHLVTVPPAGSGRDVLWERYCSALGIDPAWAPEPCRRENLSLGTAEATLIRRLNRRIEDSPSIDEATYRRLIRHRVVHESLAHRPGMVPITLPPSAFGWVEEVADEWMAWVADAGIDVVGDLEDLRPVRPAPDLEWADPDRPKAGAMLDTALQVIEVLLAEAASRAAPPAPQPSRMSRATRRLARGGRRLLHAGPVAQARLGARPRLP